MALINALRSSFSSKQNWGNSACLYMLYRFYFCYRLQEINCVNTQSYRKHFFQHTQLTIFLFNFPYYSHSPISFSSSKKPKPQRILPFHPNFVACLTQLADYSPVLLGRGQGNMSCTIATCMEPENWVKILFYFPIHCAFSFSSQQFSVHIHKLFFMTRKSFSRCLFN